MMSNSLSQFFHQFSHFWRHVIPNIRSYYGKITLVAIISLLIVIFFVLLLHAYARWFLGQAHYRRRRSVSISHVLNNPTLLHHHIQTQFIYDDTHTGFLTDDGLDLSVIASLPLFVYKSGEYNNGLECAICLSAFEDEDKGRQLPKCHHAFHVECLDMWLQSHSSCPICRASVKSAPSMEVDTLSNNEESVIDSPETVIIEELTMEEVLIEMPPPPFSMGGTLQRNMSLRRSELKVLQSSGVNELTV